MVYRPPRKKDLPERPGFPANKPDSDPLEGPLQGSPKSSGVGAGDDRNLVAIDDNLAGVDFEDRMWLLWHRHNGMVMGWVTVILLGVVVWQGWKLWQKHLVSVMQDDYVAAETGPKLQAFAHDYPDAPLAHIALLEAGDKFFKATQYKDAASAYGEASAAFAKDATAPNSQSADIKSAEGFGQRARMGRAIALVLGGDMAGGTKELQAIAVDTSVIDNFRAEAGYHLAVLSLQAGDTKSAQGWIDRVKALPKAGSWAIQATNLGQIAPTVAGMLSQASVPASASGNSSATSSMPAPPAALPALSLNLSASTPATSANSTATPAPK